MEPGGAQTLEKSDQQVQATSGAAKDRSQREYFIDYICARALFNLICVFLQQEPQKVSPKPSPAPSSLKGEKVQAFLNDPALMRQAVAGALGQPPSNIGSDQTGELQMN